MYCCLTSIQVPFHPCFDDVISSDVKIPKRFSLLLVVVVYDGVIIILMSNDDDDNNNIVVNNKYRRRFLIHPPSLLSIYLFGIMIHRAACNNKLTTIIIKKQNCLSCNRGACIMYHYYIPNYYSKRKN